MLPLRASLAVLSLIISVSHAWADQGPKRCVIAERTKGESIESGQQITLAVGEVILVHTELDQNSVVQRPSGAPVLVDTDIASDTLYGRIRIPSSVYACADKFKPVTNWDGAVFLEIITHSGDSGMVYQLAENGTYIAVKSSSSSGESTTRGRLHVYQDLVWARPKAKGVYQFSDWNVFVREPNGNLCYLLDGPGNEECK